MPEPMDLILRRDPQEILDAAFVYVSARMRLEGIDVDFISTLKVLDRLSTIVGFEKLRQA